MTFPFNLFILLVFFGKYSMCYSDNSDYNELPRVAIAVLIRNKLACLPYFMTCLNQLDYPKYRMKIWIYSDYNNDDTPEFLRSWKKNNTAAYEEVVLINNENETILDDEHFSSHWTPLRHRHVIELRELALDYAKTGYADYLFMLDADVFLTEPEILRTLIRRKYNIVAPMLMSDGSYSNFWVEKYKGRNVSRQYYQEHEYYVNLLNRKKKYRGCHSVPMVHSAVLISLEHSKSVLLTYDPKKAVNYTGPEEDIVVFAETATNLGFELTLCNDMVFGYVAQPHTAGLNPAAEVDMMINLKVEAIGLGRPLPLDPRFARWVYYPKLTTLGCDHIYMINLERRPERKANMHMAFKELGMKVTTVKALDGRNLTTDYLLKRGVKLMPNYEDPYHKRPMKAGEIGCFLSHYTIWKKIIDNGHKLTMILEDDVHFTPNFRQNFVEIMRETRDEGFDLLYLGRKILMESAELAATRHTTRPLYSYWTIGYVLSFDGAQKLLEANPLKNLLPVDEFLPIMFNQHPNQKWKSQFPKRELRALSAWPLLMHPTHYTGSPGYVSDTEDSAVVDVDTLYPLPSLDEL